MRPQIHRIQRAVMELTVASDGDEAALFDRVSRFHRTRVVPVLDEVCSTLSDPNRIHRIARIELDLGRFDLTCLEDELEDRLRVAFHRALEEKITHGESLGPDVGARSLRAALSPESVEVGEAARSQLELFLVFIRTGTLPWWADVMRTDIVTSALRTLLKDSSTALVHAVRAVAHTRPALRRLAAAFDDGLLGELGAQMNPSLSARLVRSIVGALTELGSGSSRDLRRVSLGRRRAWFAFFAAAAVRAGEHRALEVTCEEVLLSFALESRLMYRTVVADFQAALRAADRPAAGHPRETASSHGGTQAEIARDTPPDPMRHARQEPAADIAPDPVAEIAPESAGNIPQLARSRPPEREQLIRVAARLDAATRGLGDDDDVASRTEIARLLDRLDSSSTAPTDVCGVLGAVVPDLPPRLIGTWLNTLAALIRSAADSRVGDVRRGLRELLETTAPHRLLDPADLVRCFKHVATEDAASDRPLDLTFSESDELYIENAGLVVLWPFLSRFFEYRGLLEDEAFKDATCVWRAVALLHHLATGNHESPEFALPLCKLLCGLDVEDVFELESPLTNEETGACDELLSVAIAKAPILNDMSIAGFRASFLIRKGVLGVSGRAWRLRVERETFDIVLDRFPWILDWIKLPWMNAPLRVEW